MPNALFVAVKAFLLLVCFFCCCNGAESIQQTPPPQAPNILLILLDDLGYSDVSFNYEIYHQDITKQASNPPIHTPNIDSIAHEGIIFKRHYSHWLCGPSRSALISSRLAYKLGNPFDAPSFVNGDMDANISTWMQFLHNTNYNYNYNYHYRSSFIGKWGIDTNCKYKNFWTGDWIPRFENIRDNVGNKKFHGQCGKGPISRGFDTFYGLFQSEHDHYSKKFLGVYDWHIYNETHMIDDSSNMNGINDINIDEFVESDTVSTDIFIRETINRMQEHLILNSQLQDEDVEQGKAKDARNERKDVEKGEDITGNIRPFFIFLSMTAPHDPLQIEDNYIWDNEYCSKLFGDRRRTYCGMVNCIDQGIGKIIHFMKKNDLYDNTIILFLNDNGGTPVFGGFNYPLRGTKATCWEGGLRTPAFIKLNKIIQDWYINDDKDSKDTKDSNYYVYDEMVHLVDHGPTLLSLIKQTLLLQTGTKSDDHHDNRHQSLDSFIQDSEIDGIDLSYSFRDLMNGNVNINSKQNNDNDKADVDGQGTGTLYRRRLIGESNIWANMTAYYENNYKLIIGNTGDTSLYVEPSIVAVSSLSECVTPDDNCGITLSQLDNIFVHLDNRTIGDMIEEYFNYFLEKILYLPNDFSSGLEWDLHFQINCLLKQRACIHNLHPQGHIRSFYDERQLMIPYLAPNWDQIQRQSNSQLVTKDEHFGDYVKLYDLSQDISELNNIALDNVQIVNQMYLNYKKELMKLYQLKNGYQDHHMPFQFGNIAYWYIIIVVFGLIPLCVALCCLRLCYNKCVGSVWTRNKKEKEE